MRDLSGGPAELEEDDEGGEVHELSPLSGAVLTGQAGAEDEGERHQDAHSAWTAEREQFPKRHIVF